MQVAKARGAYVIALASAADAAFVRSLGADEVIDYAGTDFTDVVSDLESSWRSSVGIAATYRLDQAATAQSVKAGPGKVVLTLS